jgi:hypothetical protein
MATSENAEELEVAVELQGKPKLIDPSASFRSAVWKSFGFPEVDEKVDKSKSICKICFASVSYKTGTTSNMNTHLKRKHSIDTVEETKVTKKVDTKQITSDKNNKPFSNQIRL